MSGNLLGLPRFGGDSRRAPAASVQDAEESVRQRLYGERRMVQVVVPERSRGADVERGDCAEWRAGRERAVSATGPAVPAPGSPSGERAACVSKQTDEVIVKNLPPTLLGGRCLPAVRRLRSSRSLRGGAGERVDVPAMGAATGEPAAWRSVGRLAAWRWGAAPGAVSRAGIQVGHHPPGALAIERRVAGDALVFALSGALDLATRDLIHDALSEIDELAPRRLVVDLGGLTFIDASGLHKLLSLTERCREAGPALQLLPGPPPVHEAFETTGLAHRLPFTRPGGEDRVVTRAASGATIGDRCHGSRPSRARQSDGPTDDPGWRMWTRWKRLGDRCRR